MTPSSKSDSWVPRVTARCGKKCGRIWGLSLITLAESNRRQSKPTSKGPTLDWPHRWPSPERHLSPQDGHRIMAETGCSNSLMGRGTYMQTPSLWTKQSHAYSSHPDPLWELQSLGTCKNYWESTLRHEGLTTQLKEMTHVIAYQFRVPRYEPVLPTPCYNAFSKSSFWVNDHRCVAMVKKDKVLLQATWGPHPTFP